MLLYYAGLGAYTRAVWVRVKGRYSRALASHNRIAPGSPNIGNTPKLGLNASLHFFVKYKVSKFVPTAVTQRHIFRLCTEENVAQVDKLVLCQEDQPPIYRSNAQ